MEKKNVNVKNATTMLLRSMGGNEGLLGYQYAIDAVSKIFEDRTNLHAICNLYGSIGKAHNSTGARVERAIRHLAEVIWESGNTEILNKLACHELTKRPNNKTFLELLVYGVENGIAA